MWKRYGSPKRQVEIKASPLKVPPHVAAFCVIKIEWRGRPTLGLEQRPEQKRAKAHYNALVLRKRRDPHRRRVGICGSEIEPKVEKRSHHTIVRFPSCMRQQAAMEMSSVVLRAYVRCDALDAIGIQEESGHGARSKMDEDGC